jgi:hypothetical protein
MSIRVGQFQFSSGWPVNASVVGTLSPFLRCPEQCSGRLMMGTQLPHGEPTIHTVMTVHEVRVIVFTNKQQCHCQ